MASILTLAREQGLGRKEECDTLEAPWVRVVRRVVRGVEVLLVDER